MRIATASTYDSAIANMQQRQQDLADAQMRLTSGKRVLQASDDPGAAARAERALAGSEKAVATQRALQASRSAMTQAESALGDAVGLLQSSRDGLVAAGNATYTAAERQGLAAQLQQYRDQLLQIANAQDGAGRYLFAGQGADGAPFVDTSPPTGAVVFKGVAGELGASASELLPLTVDGSYAWTSAPTGNGVFVTEAVTSNGSATIDAGQVVDPTALQDLRYDIVFDAAGTSYSIQRLDPVSGTPLAPPDPPSPYSSGQPIVVDGMRVTLSGMPAGGDSFRITPSRNELGVFKVLDQAIAALQDPLASGTQVAQGVATGLRDLDAVLGRMQSARSAAGDALNRIDRIEDRNAADQLAHQVERSGAEDLDMVQAISEFQNKQSGYEAVLKTYGMVQRLSLFQYLA